MERRLKLTCTASLLLVLVIGCGDTASSAAKDAADSRAAVREPALLGLLHPDPARQLWALQRLDGEWENFYTPAILEYISLTSSPVLQQKSLELLRKRTGQDHGFDLNAWFAWSWRQNFKQPTYYADFKSRLYGGLDKRFGKYFSSKRATEIRLDEVRWGGVLQDGIPPLRQPNMISAASADYLDDDDIVFGLEVSGDLRAYPKRILAWHEMFVDTVGGIPVVGVYCTLCGSMILYESTVAGIKHEMGTSGFLFRSNKLMYDKATQSLWNTMWGSPAIGPLVGKGIRLPRRSVVTTTWGEWRRRHKETTVLSLSTGYRRDYGEGIAYRDYFATDELMFNTSKVDSRLANKAQVLGLVTGDSEQQPLAIAASFARKNPLLHERIGDLEIVVLTDDSGAMRVYATKGRRFSAWDGDRELQDTSGATWTMHEDGLRSDNDVSLPRLPSHNAFWFGWYGAYTNTRLLH